MITVTQRNRWRFLAGGTALAAVLMLGSGCSSSEDKPVSQSPAPKTESPAPKTESTAVANIPAAGTQAVTPAPALSTGNIPVPDGVPLVELYQQGKTDVVR